MREFGGGSVNQVLNIRDVPVNLCWRAKSLAAAQGKTLRQWVIEAIMERVKQEEAA